MAAIGVTGHRCLADLKSLRAGVEKALNRIERIFPAEPFTVVSALAEGADRLVARRILARPNARLVVPLPLPQSDYMTDFASAASREEFVDLLARADEVILMPPASSREQAYAAASQYVLHHCTVLIAVWDGKPAQGPGGTGEIVSQARANNLPLAWIHAGNRLPGTGFPTSLGKAQGKVTFEHLPRPDRRS